MRGQSQQQSVVSCQAGLVSVGMQEIDQTLG